MTSPNEAAIRALIFRPGTLDNDQVREDLVKELAALIGAKEPG